jgi:GAF domain-containing protein
MGFSRILFSRIRDGSWVACSAWAGEDEEFAQTMVAVGMANPRLLSGPLLESEMVRRGVPILVRDPQSNPRVHPELVAVTKTAAYVAAPVLTWGKPIGLLHADRSTERPGVYEVDRDVLAMFAEGLGVAFERNLMMERLQAMRRAADEHLRAGDLVGRRLHPRRHGPRRLCLHASGAAAADTRTAAEYNVQPRRRGPPGPDRPRNRRVAWYGRRSDQRAHRSELVRG